MSDSEITYLFTDCSYSEKQIKEYLRESLVFSAVKPEDTVLIKPNFVQEAHEYNDDWDYLITHPAIITVVLDITSEIVTGKGRIIIADSPMTPASFDKILSHMPVGRWKQICAERNVPLEIIDLRDEEWQVSENGIILSKKKLPGDPRGKILFNLQKESSEFFGKDNGKHGLYGANYDWRETNDAHNGYNNLYSVSASVLQADVFINLPKMKTHKKAGITCCLKNLVGINTNKNLLPHHTNGTPQEGGDQFENDQNGKKLERAVTEYSKKVVHSIKWLTPVLVPLKKAAVAVWGDNRKTIRSGNWYGNDTLWRTILDLNKLLLYGQADGTLKADNWSHRKRYIGIVDGILAGEKNGPLAPDKVEANVLICGSNPVAIDCVAAKVMGFDYKKIPTLWRAFQVKHYKLIQNAYAELKCVKNFEKKEFLTDMDVSEYYKFVPSLGWKNHIEL